jgi:hypothetical protein
LDVLNESRVHDGKEYGIISAGRMDLTLAESLSSIINPLVYSYYQSADQMIPMTADQWDAQIEQYHFIADTMQNILFNDLHYITVYDKKNRPISLHNLDEENRTVNQLLKQADKAFESIPDLIKSGCNFMSIIGVPQMLTGQALSSYAIKFIWQYSIDKGWLDKDGYVNYRNEIADYALNILGYSNLRLDITGADKKNGVAVGYRLKVPYDGKFHFLIGNLNQQQYYNPGRTFGDILEAVKITAYGK